MAVLELKSVGCFLDTETGDTFPCLVDGKPVGWAIARDLDGVTVHLLDIIVDEWFDMLSNEERTLCEAWISGFKAGRVMPCQHLDYALTLDGGKCNDCGIDLHESPENPHLACGECGGDPVCECAPGQCPED